MTVPDPVCTPGKPHVAIDMHGQMLGPVTDQTDSVVVVRGATNDPSAYHRKVDVWVMDVDTLPAPELFHYERTYGAAVALALAGQDSAPASPCLPLPPAMLAAVVGRPGDPAGAPVTNGQRASAAEAAVRAHSAAMEGDASLPLEAMAGDALTDFMHLCQREGWDFPSLVSRATENHEEEVQLERDALPVQDFRVKVVRKRVIWERGYLNVQAPDADAALEVAYGMEDPADDDMEVYSNSCEDCSHTIEEA